MEWQRAAVAGDTPPRVKPGSPRAQYMTLGIDVSPLFTEMVLMVETRDLVVKKMIYLYLTTYAKSNPELAVLCISTLQKDTNNIDPTVRGLALRSLTGLSLPSITEHCGWISQLVALTNQAGVLGRDEER